MTQGVARVGERQVQVTTLAEAGHQDDQSDTRFEACESVQLGGARIGARRIETEERRVLNQPTAVVAAVVCGLALLMPHEGDHWLSLSVTNKMVASSKHIQCPIEDIKYRSYELDPKARLHRDNDNI